MADRGFRPNPYIVARFFERLRRAKGGRLQKTRLQVATGLKWPDFSKYLERLVELGLLGLEQESGETFVKPTAKGREVYDSLLQLLGELTKL